MANLSEAIIGFILGVAFMRIMNALAMRACCEKHFLSHVDDGSCRYGTCKAKPNHHGWCNLHWGLQ